MAITENQEKQLRDLLQVNLLDDEELENDEPWGEDGAIDSFERGQPYGADQLAREILAILEK